VEYFLLKHHVFMINMFTVLGNVSRFFCVCERFFTQPCAMMHVREMDI